MIRVEGPRERLEEAVDDDISGFNAYQMEYLKNWDPGSGVMVGVPLTGHERAIIKTYLAYKLRIGPGLAPKEGQTDAEEPSRQDGV
jgi:hypothetical protein